MSSTLLNRASEWPYLARSAATPQSASVDDESTRLSERETEIMHWVGNGKTNHEIGMILGISQFTVKNHLQRIFRKIDVRNRAQAVTRILALNNQTTSLQ